MRGILAPLAAFALLLLGGLAQADVFHLGAGLTNLETVTVGDAENASDTRVMGTDHTTGYGSVGYNYNIGKYEVTAAQYCDFLNHKANVSDDYGLYNSNMWSDPSGCKIQQSGSAGYYSYSVASDYANRPVNFVSYWDACRFTNWLGNGQGIGDTETGAYTLSGYNGYDGRTIQRNANWTWAVTSEDEWYKAAYYKGGETNAGYWDYATRSDSVDTSMANYMGIHTTNVGSYGYTSAYGTFDQAGNVDEWNEAIPYSSPGYAARCLRGGSGSDLAASAAFRVNKWPASEYAQIGFRVSAAVPEPSPILALLASLTSILVAKRRRP